MAAWPTMIHHLTAPLRRRPRPPKRESWIEHQERLFRERLSKGDY